MVHAAATATTLHATTMIAISAVLLSPPEDLELLDKLPEPADALDDAVCVFEMSEGTALVTVACKVEVTADDEDETAADEDCVGWTVTTEVESGADELGVEDELGAAARGWAKGVATRGTDEEKEGGKNSGREEATAKSRKKNAKR